jgi:rubredoxin
MKYYQCITCGYVYDENEGDAENDIPAGTEWGDLPDNWICPVCGTDKRGFEKID